MALLLLFALVAPAVIVLGVLIAVHVMPATLSAKSPTLSWPLLAVQLLSYLPAIALLVWLLPRIARRSLAALGLRAPHWSDLAWGVGGAILMVLAATAVGALQTSIWHLKTDEVQVEWLRNARGAMVAGFVFLACIAAPFSEEFVFRGFVFNAFLRYLPTAGAVVLSALLFGVAHWQPGNAGAIAPLVAGGIVLAGVYYRSGSLLASMITHGLFNLVTVVAVVGFHLKT